MIHNRRFLLVRLPQGIPVPEDFKLEGSRSANEGKLVLKIAS